SIDQRAPYGLHNATNARTDTMTGQLASATLGRLKPASRGRGMPLGKLLLSARVGRDGVIVIGPSASTVFQSTRPGWGATGNAAGEAIFGKVSIHAPRVGRDRAVPQLHRCHQGFNPRAPGGARPSARVLVCSGWLFQSTRPGWGATVAVPAERSRRPVSIHAPRVGRDGY